MRGEERSEWVCGWVQMRLLLDESLLVRTPRLHRHTTPNNRRHIRQSIPKRRQPKVNECAPARILLAKEYILKVGVAMCQG